jgi:hypothetical protein
VTCVLRIIFDKAFLKRELDLVNTKEAIGVLWMRFVVDEVPILNEKFRETIRE